MMKRRVFYACLLASFLQSIGASAARAQTGPNLNLLETKGEVDEHNWFSPFAWEHFDAVSGNLLLTFTDLTLPGNAGRELRFTRVFNSNYGAGDVSRWRFGLSGMVMKIVERAPTPDYFDFQDNIYLITQSTPTFIMADGAEHPTAYVSEPNGHTAAQLHAIPVISGQFLRYDRISGTLTMPDGTVAHYLPDGTMDPNDPTRLIWTLRDFSDPFGNTVTLTDGTDLDGTATRTITQALGNGETRQIVFRLNPDGNPSSMTFAGRTWSYQYVPSANALRDLQTITLPTSDAWTFAYDSSTGAITDITLPIGGHIQYGYGPPRSIYDYNFPEDPSHSEEFIGLSSRAMYDGANVLGTWSLLIGPTYRDVPTSNGSITTPSGTIINFSSGATAMTNNVLDGGVGTTTTTVLNAGGATVHSETLTYSMVPSVDYGNSHWWGTSELTRRDITRTEASGSHTYTTTYTYDDPTSPGTFDNYHHPISVVENNNFGLARTTTRAYQHLSQPYVLALPTSEQISINGVTPLIRAWTYDASTGFRQTETVAGIATAFANDGLGNIAQVTKANQKTTAYTYSFGQVSHIATSEPGYTIGRAINPDGTTASETKGGRTTSYAYDNLMRMITITPPGGTNVISTNYSDPRAVVTTRGASTTTALLDAFGRPAGTIDAAGVRRSTRYDAEGRLTFQGYPVNSADPDIGVTIAYDALGRETQRTNPDGSAQTRTYGYDASTLPSVTIHDENAHATVQGWLPFGSPDDARLVSVTDAAGNTWGYGYNVAGQLTSVGAPDGTSRLWSHNTQFRLASETHPESGTTTYTYDAAGVLATKTDADGAVFTYGYDGNDRLRSTTVGSQVTAITYEPGSDNRQTTSNASAASLFLYDGAGRLQQRQDVIDGKVFGSQFVYDADDNLRATIYPSGRRIDYDVNAARQITHVFETAAGRDYAIGMTYHPSGGLATSTAGNLTSTTIAYNPQRYWVTAIDSGTLHFAYNNYDFVGNVQTIADLYQGTSQTLTYDALDRLWTAIGPYGSFAYAYDPHGNWQTANSTTYTYEMGTLRLASQGGISFTYDANGNTRTVGPASYTYTPYNMLQSASASGVTTSYAYDADDARTKKSSNGSNTYFLHGAHGELLTEWKDPGTATGTIRDYVYAGSRLLSAIAKTTSQDPNNSCGTILANGSAVSVTAVSGQNPCFKFAGTTGQVVSALLTLTTAPNCNWYIRILRPDGSTLTSYFTCNSSVLYELLDQTTLQDTGMYTLVIDPQGTTSGTFSIALYTVGDLTGSILADGTPINAAITTPGQNARYTFAGTAGQAVSALLTLTTAPNCNWYIRLLKPDGSTLVSYFTCSTSVLYEFLDSTTLPVSGMYTLVVDPGGITTGPFSIALYNVVDFAGPISADGTPINGTITTPGQNGRYTFAGTAGQAVSALLTLTMPPNCNWYIRLLRPDGSTLANYFTCSTSVLSEFLDQTTLPVTGTYTLMVDPVGITTGPFSIALYADVNLAGPILTDGTPINGTITTPGQNGRYTFAGTAGQAVSALLTLTTPPNCNWYIRLLKPDGSTLASSFTCSTSVLSEFLDQTTLPVTGTYTLMVDPVGITNGPFTIALYVVPADATCTITVGGTSAILTTTVPGQNAKATFSGGAGQAVTVHFTSNTMSAGPMSVDVRLLKPDGNILYATLTSASNFDLPRQTLPTTGTYTISINPGSANVGSITVAATSP